MDTGGGGDEIVERIMSQHWSDPECLCWVCIEGRALGLRPHLRDDTRPEVHVEQPGQHWIPQHSQGTVIRVGDGIEEMDDEIRELLSRGLANLSEEEIRRVMEHQADLAAQKSQEPTEATRYERGIRFERAGTEWPTARPSDPRPPSFDPSDPVHRCAYIKMWVANGLNRSEFDFLFLSRGAMDAQGPPYPLYVLAEGIEGVYEVSVTQFVEP
jgi:hypothetical protein